MGGLIRSVGGWAAVKELKRSAVHLMSAERIPGDGGFVSEIQLQAEESFERRCAESRRIRSGLCDQRGATLWNIAESDLWRECRKKERVRARSLPCFRALPEPGRDHDSLGAG